MNSNILRETTLTVTQNLVDGKGDVIGVLDDSGIIIENRLSGAATAGQAAEDQGGQHEDEQHREHEQNSDGGEEFLAVLRGIPGSPRRCAVWPAHRRALCGGGDGLAGFDGPVDSMGSTGRLGQTAFFLVVQFWIPPVLFISRVSAIMSRVMYK